MAGLLERRVWTTTVRGPLYPNLFVLLITPPGRGKTVIIDPVANLWRKIGGLNIAPDNTTKASFLDVLQESGKIVKAPDNTMHEYHAVNVAASEFGVFCPAHDLEYLSVLTRVYDCGSNYRDYKRSRKDNQIDIVNPHLNLLAGTQPDYLSQFLPDAAWGQGFMARMIMVYSDDEIEFDMFGDYVELDKNLQASLIADGKLIMEQVGNVPWTIGAQSHFTTWVKAGAQPVPDHLKLKHYSVRRPFYVLKLALVSAVSRAHSEIQAEDVSRAITWLTDAEAVMPEIFKAMKGNSDYALLQELQLYVAQLFISGGGKPVHEARLVRFLAERTAAYNIPKMLEAAERSGILSKKLDASGREMWIPGEGKLGPET